MTWLATVNGWAWVLIVAGTCLVIWLLVTGRPDSGRPCRFEWRGESNHWCSRRRSHRGKHRCSCGEKR